MELEIAHWLKMNKYALHVLVFLGQQSISIKIHLDSIQSTLIASIPYPMYLHTSHDATLFAHL